MIVRSPQNGHRRGSISSGILVTPGSVALSVSGSAMKRTTAGVKAPPQTRPAKFDQAAGLHPPGKSVSNEKRILSTHQRADVFEMEDWPVYAAISVAGANAEA